MRVSVDSGIFVGGGVGGGGGRIGGGGGSDGRACGSGGHGDIG